MSQTQYPNLALSIDGQWLPTASGGEIPVVNPAAETPGRRAVKFGSVGR